MEQLNIDCLIHIASFLPFHDKISLVKTCKKMYTLYAYIFKNTIIEYKYGNRIWLKKYKADIKLTRMTKKILENVNLSSVKYIDLHGNKILSSQLLLLSQLKNIKHLNLGTTNLNVIPNQITQLTRLTYLNLSNNKINDMTPLMTPCVLENLVELCLSRNNITFIPDEIENLNNLKFLHLQFNEIAFVSSSIGNLKHLVHLDLSANCLTTIPNSIRNLNLVELYLGINELECICHCIPSTTLELLHVDNNENLYCTLPELPRLKDLCILETNVKITCIPDNCFML